MAIVSPSLLSCDFLNIERELSSFSSLDKDTLWFHLDIMDGHFVSNLTFGHPIVKKLAQATDHKLDAHLMVDNPAFYIETFKDYGLHNITFHLESTASGGQERVMETIALAKKYYPSVGLSIKPGTGQEEVSDEVLRAIDLLLAMSVEPGQGGQAFIEDVYGKLKEIAERRKALGISFQIQVDGGVSAANARKLIEHGVDNLVAGTFIFQVAAEDYPKRVESLRLGSL